MKLYGLFGIACLSAALTISSCAKSERRTIQMGGGLAERLYRNQGLNDVYYLSKIICNGAT